MDIKAIAQQHIEQALREGIITFEDGTERTVQTSTIIALSRAITKDEVKETKHSTNNDNAPSELFMTTEIVDIGITSNRNFFSEDEDTESNFNPS